MKPLYRPALLALLITACWIIAARYDIDLVVLHNAARLTHGQLERVYSYNGSLGRYFYGPFSLFLIHPLGALSYPVVKFIWIVLQTLSFGIFWWGLCRLYPFLTSPKHWPWLLVWAFSINPVHNNFQSNNIQLMLMAAMIGAELLSRYPDRVRPFLAGVIISFASAVKVFPVFLGVLYWLIKGRATKAGLVAGALLSIALPATLFGVEPTRLLFADFLHNLTTYAAENSLTNVADILCLPSLITRLLGDTPATAHIIRAVTLSLSAVFFALAWLDCRKGASESTQGAWWAMGLLLMTLLNPSTRPHYFIFYVPALCLAIEATAFSREARPWALVTTIASFVLIALTAEGVVGKTLNNQMEAWSLPTYGMLGLFLVACWALFSTREWSRRMEASLAR